MKKLEKNRHMHVRLQVLAAILARWWRPVAFTKALDLLHQGMCVVSYRHTIVAIEMASKVGLFFLSFHLLLSWQPLGQYGASSCSMVATSGLQGSPGHVTLGDAACIALTHRHGHQNGQQRRCICLSMPPLLYDNT
jgi:hypothetical protein